ncbi:MAG: hypothetical protein AAGB93_17710 [Planctomycetota bacterium]
MSSICLIALALGATAPPFPAQQADRLSTARGFGTPGAITGTEDGAFLFVAEGAAISSIEPGGSSDPDIQFDNPVDRFELGATQPHVVRMAMDPRADIGDGSSLVADGVCYRNYLFLATGHNGLWIADADIAPGLENRVARVDDSSDTPGVQDSDRHCNDVDVFTLCGRTFVVASFASREDSQLRFYRLSDVRRVLGGDPCGTAETGREIAPVNIVSLGAYGSGDPDLGYEIGANQLARSFATDLEVRETRPWESATHIYVAMRTDGIVRVEVRFWDLICGSTPPSRVRWGPRFGDGSHYATVPPPAPFPDERALYDNVEWINQQFDPDVVERSDPPYFTTLALRGRGCHGHGPAPTKLYASVDALGIVVFDIEDPSCWSPTMPIDHHEGEAIDLRGGPGFFNPGAWPERIVANSPSQDAGLVRDVIGYVRAMDVVETHDGPKLVATYAGEPSIANAPLFLEGFTYDDQFQYGGVSYYLPMRGRILGETRVFDIGDFPECSPAPTLTESVFLQAGGQTLFVPSDQSNQIGGLPADQRVEFAHDFVSSADPEEPGMLVARPSVCMVNVRLQDGEPLDSIVAIRDREFLAGRRTFGLQQSLVDPELIMTSDNDGFAREGVPYLIGPSSDRSIDVDYVFASQGGNDQRLATGVIMGRKSQWLDARLGPNQQAQIGAGTITHRVQIQTIPSQFLGSPPIAEELYNLLPNPDRWGVSGRGFYLGGMVDTRYDAWVQANVPGLETAEYFFLFRQTTPDGVVYGRRDALMDLLTGGTVTNGQFLSAGQLNAAGVELRNLNNHPEFDEFPFESSDPGYAAARAWYTQIVGPQPYSQRVKTWDPELVQVRPAPGSVHDVGWVLAVPSGVSVLDTAEYPDIPDVATTPNPYRYLDATSVQVPGQVEPSVGTSAWLPDAGSPEAEAFGHGLVMFYDFTDPQSLPVVSGKPEGSSNLPRVTLPIPSDLTPNPLDLARSSFAWHLETLEVERHGELHSYVITGDFMGAVHAHQVSSILSGTPPTLEDTWLPPDNPQDFLTSNVRDVILDREADPVRAYVAVQRLGVVILELSIDPQGALSFHEVGTLDDVREPLTLHLRVIEETGERLLYVSDSRQALRVYSSM